MSRACLALILALACAVAAPACGEEDLTALERDARERVDRVRERAERLREAAERLADRVREQLEEIERAIPSASLPQPDSEGRTEASEIDTFLTEVLRNVDRYWTRTLAASQLPEPRVTFSWVPPGGQVLSGCGAVADDNAAFYCPADDTIFIARVFAERVWRGVADEFPGTRAGAGRAIGDFGLAYVVAHEYAHNLQHELGFFARGTSGGTPPSSCRPTAWPASGPTPSTAPGSSSPATWRRRRAPRWPSATSSSRAPATTARRSSGATRGCSASATASRPSAAATCRPEER